MYVIDYLLRHGYKYTDRKIPAINEFKCLVGEQGQFYSISFTGETGTISLWDSLKIFNFSVDEIAQTFKLETQKGEIDYNKERPTGYIPDEVELSYVKNDVMIVAQAIRMFLSKGYTKMTIASNALEQFKLTLDKKQFNYMFPKLPRILTIFVVKHIEAVIHTLIQYIKIKLLEWEVCLTLIVCTHGLYTISQCQ